MGKYYSINPETCSIEELKAAIAECENKAEFYDACQLGVKLFLNSVYGAMASAYYVCNNLKIAESVTLQGQDLIKYSMKIINKYFKNDWHLDTKVHEEIANMMLKKYPDFNKAKFMELATIPLQFGETLQCYGDSVTGDALIRTNTGYFSIESLFNTHNTYIDGKQKIRVAAPDLKIYAYNIKTSEMKYLPVKYIMRHFTNKRIFEINCKKTYVNNNEVYFNKSIKCTEDHSLIICHKYENKIIKPYDINKETDFAIIHTENVCTDYSDGIESFLSHFSTYAKTDIKEIPNNGQYVYDICVDSDDENWHTFFANDILVHNTDSVSKDSIIYTEKHPQGITIENLYNEGKEDAGTTFKGHESKKLNDKVLNFNDSLYYGNVERIIRHKVNKPMWKLKTGSGKEIICTEDHSLIVFRNGKKIKVKPSEIISEDQVLCVE